MTWELKQSITGGKLLRKPAGVTDGVSVYVNKQDITFTFDFTVSDWGFRPVLDVLGRDVGVYTPGVGWQGSTNDFSGTYYNAVSIRKLVHGSATITDATVNYSLTTGDIVPDTGDINGITAGGNILYSNLAQDPTPDPMTWSGTQALIPGDDFGAGLIASIKSGSSGGGSATITSMSITFDGDNFCGVGQLIYSDDTGDTISTTEIEGSGDHANGCFDVDDFGAGVFVVGNGTGITYTETYTDANALPLTGLTGLDGSALVSVVRIPYKKLLTQELNDDPEALQFIYGTSSAVSGATLWAVTFDATDGTILNQTDITPSFSAAPHYVVGANALETSGADTRVILAFAKPAGGGDTKLIRTANGGASWAVAQNNLDGDYVKWAPGSTQRAWLSGAAGLRYTTNRGSTMQNKTTGTTGTPLGVLPLG